MKAALLCPGPSLQKFRGHGERYQWQIGVNRAVLFTPCDWWSFGDIAVFQKVHPTGNPKIWTRQSCALEMLAVCRDDLPRAMLHENYFGVFAPETCWTKYSSLAGLVLAKLLGADQVDCYGCDMQGTGEFDGSPMAGINRGENRWRDERWWWGEVTAMLENRGMMVRIVK